MRLIARVHTRVALGEGGRGRGGQGGKGVDREGKGYGEAGRGRGGKEVRGCAHKCTRK